MKQKLLIRLTEALTLLMCLALCLTVLALYRDGLAGRAASGSAAAPLFTREGVGAALARLAPLAALWAASALAALLLVPRPGRDPVPQDPARVLALLRPRIPRETENARKEQAFRKRTALLCGLGTALCLARPLYWIALPAHFAAPDPEAALGQMLLNLLPGTAAALALLWGGSLLLDRSRERELDAVLELFRQEPLPRRSVPMHTLRETRGLRLLRACLYALAAALLVLGVLNGGLNDVLVKAINICTECIGLG